MPKTPEYRRIADALRARIEDGTYPPDSRMPSLSQVEDEWRVSQETSTKAYRWLVQEGYVIPVVGKGHYARGVPLVRDARRWYRRGDGSPFRAEQRAAGRAGDWDCESEESTADDRTARRLGIEPGSPVMFSRYTFKVNDRPANLSRSWEPLSLTGGTPVHWPERGVAYGRGVLDRMAMIGIECNRAEESCSARRATDEEALLLRVAPRSPVLVIQRTFFYRDAHGQERAAETADVIYPSGFTAIYDVPVRDAE